MRNQPKVSVLEFMLPAARFLRVVWSRRTGFRWLLGRSWDGCAVRFGFQAFQYEDDLADDGAP